MYAVFERYPAEVCQRAYELFTSLPIADAHSQPPANQSAYRVADFAGSPDRRALICPIGACNALAYGGYVSKPELCPGATYTDPWERRFILDYDGGMVDDLAAAMGAVEGGTDASSIQAVLPR